MEITVVEKKGNRRAINYWLVFFLTLFLTTFAVAMLIKVLNPVFNQEEGLTKDFFFGPAGVINFSLEYWNNGIAFRVDLIANIFLLIVAPSTFLLWIILSIVAIYTANDEIVIEQSDEAIAEDSKCEFKDFSPIFNINCVCGKHEETPLSNSNEITATQEVVEEPVVEEVVEEVVVEEVQKDEAIIEVVDSEEVIEQKVEEKAQKPQRKVASKKAETPVVVEEALVSEEVLTEEPVKTKAPRAPRIKREQVSKKMILEELIANNPDMTKKSVKAVVDDVFATMQRRLEESEEVTISGFGKLVTIAKPSKVSRNPLTGESINIPAQTGVKFKPSKTLKEKMK
ncbi:HU family DNA-binding protein [Mesoplasma seiffertii]|uniref:HU family DNA-binding protein n=1 Tax=Mesoplasma seiffertii TaxID=28224 RepID=UPI000688DA0F|nr:HU family DNA-binding protein [Mesoplasma seiffertii]